MRQDAQNYFIVAKLEFQDPERFLPLLLPFSEADFGTHAHSTPGIQQCLVTQNTKLWCSFSIKGLQEGGINKEQKKTKLPKKTDFTYKARIFTKEQDVKILS